MGKKTDGKVQTTKRQNCRNVRKLRKVFVIPVIIAALEALTTKF